MDFFSESWMADRMLILIPLVLSLTVHEWAHAMSARLLGDDTAEREGRLTLNPLDHMDPVGTFLLPLMGVPFGWAKPVPINIGKLRGSVDAGIVLTAAAGPVSNLAVALVATGLLAGSTALGLASPWVIELGQMLVFINLLLAFFNMLPVPPLDGSRVVEGLCPARLRAPWNAFASIGPWALAIVLIGPLLLGVPVFDPPIRLARALVDAAIGFAG